MNADALRARVRQKAEATGIPHDTYYQHIFLRRFLARMATTRYKDNFVLKGGMLVSAVMNTIRTLFDTVELHTSDGGHDGI